LLRVHHITHVINVTEGVAFPLGFQIKQIQIKSRDEESQNLISVFVPAIKFIEDAIQTSGRVLVFS